MYHLCSNIIFNGLCLYHYHASLHDNFINKLFDPYKDNVKHYTVIDAFFIILLSVFYISFLGTNIVDVQAHMYSYKISFIAISLLAVAVAIIYISVITLHWIYSRRRWGKQLLVNTTFRIFAR